METVKIQLTEEEKKRNREQLAAILLERVEQNRRELEERKNDPIVQKFVAELIEKEKTKRNNEHPKSL
ncbi:MAG: hypothetical protein ABI761_18455 [Saprospiraceae bacterium]